MNKTLFEIAFEYDGKLYTEAVNARLIDPNHYEEIYDYWFGENDEGLCFELNGRKDENNNFLPENLCVCVYLSDDSINPDSILTDLWLKMPGDYAFTKAPFTLK